MLFHALNGIRVILVDFWSKGPKYQSRCSGSSVAIWVIVMVAGAFLHAHQRTVELFGSGS